MKNTVELVIIIDKSGSMQPLKSDVIGGFNSLIESQKKEEGETLVTTVFFNDKVQFVHEDMNIQKVKEIDGRNYQPCGCTALLDAIGDSISLIKAKHAKLKENDLPKHTIFSIMTDGLENASKEYTYARVKEMIELQKKCGWEFLFQAANIDTEFEADRLGIDRDCTMTFKANSKGVQNSVAFCYNSISDLRRKTSRNSTK